MCLKIIETNLSKKLTKKFISSKKQTILRENSVLYILDLIMAENSSHNGREEYDSRDVAERIIITCYRANNDRENSRHVFAKSPDSHSERVKSLRSLENRRKIRSNANAEIKG